MVVDVRLGKEPEGTDIIFNPQRANEDYYHTKVLVSPKTNQRANDVFYIFEGGEQQEIIYKYLKLKLLLGVLLLISVDMISYFHMGWPYKIGDATVLTPIKNTGVIVFDLARGSLSSSPAVGISDITRLVLISF